MAELGIRYGSNGVILIHKGGGVIDLYTVWFFGPTIHLKTM